MKVLKEAFITKTSIDEIVSAAEKHPVAIERLKKIRDQKKEGYFEDLVKDIYPNGVALENLFDLLETDADLVEEEIGIKFEVNEALTPSDKYIPHLRGRSFHTMTTDRKFDVDVDEEGNVVASERHFPRRYFSGHISNKVSEFPYTDEDNIIIAAREQHKRNFGKDESLKESRYEVDDRAYNVASAVGRILKAEGHLDFSSVKDIIWEEIDRDDVDDPSDFIGDVFSILIRKGFNQDDAVGEFYTYEYAEEHPEQFGESLKEKFSIGANDIQTVKVYNPYNYTIQELRINNRDKTFERGTFTMGKPDKKTHNRQEYEDVVDELLSKGYKEIPSDWKSLRNKTRKGIPQREELTEGKYGFLKKYKDYRIIETPSSYVVTDKFGTTKGESKTLSGAEGLIDELVGKKESIEPPMNIPTRRKSNPMSVKDFARRNGYDVKKLQRDYAKEFGYENDPNFNADESLTEANTQDVERQLERAKSAGDDTQAWDLALCIENDEDIYNRFITPAIKNLQRKNKRGIFDRTLAVQLFYYVVENSLKDHPRWFPYGLRDVSVPTRYLAAEELYNFFEDEIKAGESLSESVIYKTRKEAEKEKERNDVIVKVDGGYQLMSPEEYRVWKMQK